MKKIIGVIAAAAVGVGIIAGCASDSNLGGSGASSAVGPANSVRFTLKVPHKRGSGLVGPKFISPSTQSISITVDNGAPAVSNLTPTSPNCTPPSQNSPLTCDVNIVASPGMDSFSATTFDQPNAAGNALS